MRSRRGISFTCACGVSKWSRCSKFSDFKYVSLLVPDSISVLPQVHCPGLQEWFATDVAVVAEVAGMDFYSVCRLPSIDSVRGSIHI